MNKFFGALMSAAVSAQTYPEIKVSDFVETTFTNKVDHFNF
jgi:hypothetical protein